MRTLNPSLLLAFTAACLGDITTKEPGGRNPGRDPVVLDCGYNARQDDDVCVCKPHFDWCEQPRGQVAEGVDCCAWDARAFTVTVVDAKVLPFQDLSTDEPWDWDGDIPDWLIEAMSLVGAYYPQAATWAEVMDLVDEYAPELMESYIPPDPFIDAYIGDAYLSSSVADQDTYEPYWGYRETFSLRGSEEGWLEIYDEDLVIDDEVLYLGFTHDDLAWVAGPDDITVQDVGFLYELTIRVEPVW